jgi:hypothetical protein
MAETKHEKFVRIGNRRIADTLNCFRLLTNLKSSTYDSSPELRSEMIRTLRRGLNALEDCWIVGDYDKEAFGSEENPNEGKED